MGREIKFRVEVLKNNTWKQIQKIHFISEKNDILFSALSKVSYDLGEPIFTPGLPDDVSETIKQEYNTEIADWGEVYFPGHATLETLLNVDWDKYCNIEVKHRDSVWLTHKYSYMLFIEGIEKLKTYSTDYNALRCVIWYDM